MMSSTVIEVKALQKSFKQSVFSKEKKVLKHVEFSISKGVTTGFLGANGSGKTTALKCLLGLLPMDQGEVSFFENLSLSKKVFRRIGFLPEQPYFYNYLTGEELLLFYGRLSTSLKLADLKSQARSLLKRLGLYEVKDQKLSIYSKGMLQKIGVAQALIHSPEFLILDEPMSGLDPDSRLQVGELIQNLAKQGLTVFFSSHLLYDVERLCQELVILKQGKMAYTGSVQELLKRIKTRRQISYLEKNKKQQIFVESLEACQSEIDKLRKRSCVILDVQWDQNSLERAFVKITE